MPRRQSQRDRAHDRHFATAEAARLADIEASFELPKHLRAHSRRGDVFKGDTLMRTFGDDLTDEQIRKLQTAHGFASRHIGDRYERHHAGWMPAPAGRSMNPWHGHSKLRPLVIDPDLSLVASIGRDTAAGPTVADEAARKRHNEAQMKRRKAAMRAIKRAVKATAAALKAERRDGPMKVTSPAGNVTIVKTKRAPRPKPVRVQSETW